MFLHSRGHSDSLKQLLTRVQFGDIRSTARQPGIDKFFPKQLVCCQAEKNLEFLHREPQSNECQMYNTPLFDIRHFRIRHFRIASEE